MKRILPFLALIALTVTACKDNKDTTDDTNNTAAVKPPVAMDYSVMKTYPHDSSSFTEGIVPAERTVIRGNRFIRQKQVAKSNPGNR
jgi:glutamine cyclotransferase